MRIFPVFIGASISSLFLYNFKDKTFKQKLIDKKHEFIDIIIEYANNYYIDKKQRSIPDHLHWHARPIDWVSEDLRLLDQTGI